MFLSAWTGDGDLGGVSGADGICNRDANRPNSTRRYQAFLGVPGVREPGTDWPLEVGMRYYRRDGTTPIGTADVDGLLPFPLHNSVDPLWRDVWTGLTNGFVAVPSCAGWNSSSSSSVGRIGWSIDVGINFLTVEEVACNTTDVHLYCVERPCLASEVWDGSDCQPH
jgi:hypothetical protein